MHVKLTSLTLDHTLLKVTAIVAQAEGAVGTTVQWTVPLDTWFKVRDIITASCPVQPRS